MVIDVIKAVKDQFINFAAPCDGNPSPSAWSQQQWHEAFSFMFLKSDSPSGHVEHNDDLLFFVHSDSQPCASIDDTNSDLIRESLDKGPFSVRRRGHQLSSDWGLSGRLFFAISWDKTLLLNLVLQTHYVLTMIVCR